MATTYELASKAKTNELATLVPICCGHEAVGTTMSMSQNCKQECPYGTKTLID